MHSQVSIARGAEALDRLTGSDSTTADSSALAAPEGRSANDASLDQKDARKHSGDGVTRKSQATVLLELCESLELFCDADLNGYIIIQLPDRREVLAIQSAAFQRWLEHQHYSKIEKAARAQALKEALNTLEAKARYRSPKRQVFRRVAWLEDSIYIDLADDKWRVIEIDANGWRVLDQSPVMFIRSAGMGALPVPAEGHLVDLSQLLNIRAEDFPLIVGWLLMAARGKGPYPILAVQGEQGSGKSSFTRVMRNLIDPSSVPLRGLTSDVRDLVVTASNNYVVVLDNLSGLSHEISDVLCRFATGGGFAERKLYTNSEEVIVNIQRPVILNGIDEIATRGDLMDRAIVIHLPVITDAKRIDEREAQKRFDELHPAILGGLCEALSHALLKLPSITLLKKPRMADFATWGTAAEDALKWPRGTFMRAYGANRDSGIESALDAAPFAEALIGFMTGRTIWRGTASDLLDVFDQKASERARKSPMWPKTGNGVTNALKRAGPLLRHHGINIVKGMRSGRSGNRIMEISKTEEQASVASVVPGAFSGASVCADALLTEQSLPSEYTASVLSAESANATAFLGATDATDTTIRNQHTDDEVEVDI